MSDRHAAIDRCSATCSAPRRCARCSATPAFLARCVEVEAALARAQARLGIIPAEAAGGDLAARPNAIAAGREPLDLDAAEARDRDGRLPDPAAGAPARRPRRRGRALAALGRDDAGHHGHRRGVADPRRAGADRGRSDGGCAAISRRWPASTATRRWPAAPICSTRCRSPSATRRRSGCRRFDRHAERLRELRPRVLLAQFGGAAGTLASLGSGERGARARVGELAQRTGSRRPADHLARRPRHASPRPCSSWRWSAAASARSPYDVMLMSATEFGEAAEPFVAGRGSSSTMPQKRNPISCELILAAAKALRQQAGLALDAMVSRFRARDRPLARRMDRGAGELRLCRRRAAPERVSCSAG